MLLYCFSPALITSSKSFNTRDFYANPNLNDSQLSIVSSSSSYQNSNTQIESLSSTTTVSLKQHLRDFLHNAKLILANKVYLFIVICTIFETFIIKGFSSYLTKYLEYQYRLPASTSTMIAGTIGFISLVFGTLTGAFLVKKFHWSIKQCSKFVTCILFTTSFLFLGFLIYCPQAKYINSENESYQNSSCKCDNNFFYPVCYENRLIFQSPCHAGCKESHLNYFHHSYTGCSILEKIINNNHNQTQAFLATCSRPDRNCIGNLVLVSIFGLLILFLSSVVILPLLRIILESIGEENQSFALGIRSLLTKLFGNIPGPIVFAAAVDRACIQWTQRQSTNSKTCRLYNNQMFSNGLGLLGFMFRFLSACFAFVTLIFIIRTRKYDVKSQEDTITVPGTSSCEQQTRDNMSKTDSKANNREISNLAFDHN
jgi:organic anion transporter 4A